jgi:glycosyltransferase involved in cell wall biosynthesis
MSRRSLNTYQRHILIRSLERRWHGAMQAVIGNSLVVVEQLKDEGVASGRLGLIYNGIDSSRFIASGTRETNRARLNLPPSAFVLCVVANLIPYKGHSDLIEALALARPNLPAHWRLLVVGRDDGIGKTLREQAQQLGLQDNIVFLGTRNDVAGILAASDIGVLPSHEEGFPNAILEGMAAGLPMVATRVGGNAEAVRDGETGFLVAGRDSKGLAAAIVKLANDAPLRARLAAAGRERVAQNFDLPRFVQSHKKLYEALQSGRRPVDVPEIAVRPAAGSH